MGFEDLESQPSTSFFASRYAEVFLMEPELQTQGLIKLADLR